MQGFDFEAILFLFLCQVTCEKRLYVTTRGEIYKYFTKIAYKNL